MTITREAMAGLDPYDALRGSRVPDFVRSSRRLRQATIQLRKRSRLDLSRALGVEPFLMAKTVGCYAAAEARRAASGAKDSNPAAVVEVLLGDQTIARLDHGAWGYEFDVQTRWAFYPAGSANLIATVFCARGLGEAAEACGVEEWRERMHQGARFVDGELRGGEEWYRYTPDSDVLVHNANLLGAGLCAASGSLAGDALMVERALAAALVTVGLQHEDGSWPYGEGGRLDWCDNFHTAYNLDGLLLVWLASADRRVERALRVGCEYWVERFFGPDGEPHYYADGRGPCDVHSAGTAIDVASRLALHGFETAEVARRVAEWTKRHLISPDGTTYYQWSEGRVDRRHFVRWGDAHVALGLSSLALLDAGVISVLESATAERGAR